MRHPPARRVANRGLTLIELMIAVVVVGILAAVAYPSFMDSVRKSRRADAFAALAKVQQAQERWRANNASYASDLSSAPPGGLGLPTNSSDGLYAISLANTGASGYEAIATAVSGRSQASDNACGKLGVRMQAGNLTYGGTSAGGTLSYVANHPCWNR